MSNDRINVKISIEIDTDKIAVDLVERMTKYFNEKLKRLGFKPCQRDYSVDNGLLVLFSEGEL